MVRPPRKAVGAESRAKNFPVGCVEYDCNGHLHCHNSFPGLTVMSRYPSLLLVLSFLTLASTTSAESWGQGGVARAFKSKEAIQYSPADPQQRGRLFNLQTGHAGAFYNCDGEEDKRFSPHICWSSRCGSPWYRSISDVLRWKRDRIEIAQRICDGAGACCGKKCKSSSCGCSACSDSIPIEVVDSQTSADVKSSEELAQSDEKDSGVISILKKSRIASRLTSSRVGASQTDVDDPSNGESLQVAKPKLPPVTEPVEKAIRSASLLERARAATRR